LNAAGRQQGLLLGYADVRMGQVRPAFDRLAAIIEAQGGGAVVRRG